MRGEAGGEVGVAVLEGAKEVRVEVESVAEATVRWQESER